MKGCLVYVWEVSVLTFSKVVLKKYINVKLSNEIFDFAYSLVI